MSYLLLVLKKHRSRKNFYAIKNLPLAKIRADCILGREEKQENEPVSGLRQRQKDDRRLRILEAARMMVAGDGFERATIEAIAREAGVSGVTVHNYYGTKSGILLALVAESDRKLVERMPEHLAGAEHLVELGVTFGATIRAHALENLNRRTWRQVIAASIIEAETPFARAYHDLDVRLAHTLVKPLERLRAMGRVSKTASADALSLPIFNLQNQRFVDFIASETMTSDMADSHLRTDLEVLSEALCC